MIFKVDNIPDKWKITYVYPISKLTDWHYNITKIRLIILLEIIQKAFIKILNNRLSKIITKYKILKGYKIKMAGCLFLYRLHVYSRKQPASQK